MKYTKWKQNDNTGIVLKVDDVDFDNQYYYMMAVASGDELNTFVVQIHPRNVISISNGDGYSYSLSAQSDRVMLKDYHITAVFDAPHGELMLIVPTSNEVWISDRVL